MNIEALKQFVEDLLDDIFYYEKNEIFNQATSKKSHDKMMVDLHNLIKEKRQEFNRLIQG